MTASAELSRTTYEMVLPPEAVRMDNKGSYVLRVEQTQTILGLRNVLSRVDVTVLEQKCIRCCGGRAAVAPGCFGKAAPDPLQRETACGWSSHEARAVLSGRCAVLGRIPCGLRFVVLERAASGAAGGISLRYGEALEPRVVASALEYARDGRNNALGRPHSGLCGRERPLPTGGRRPSGCCGCAAMQNFWQRSLFYTVRCPARQARADARYPARWPGSFGERWM